MESYLHIIKALRIGIYIIFLEAINEEAGVVEYLKTVVVIAGRLCKYTLIIKLYLNCIY
jgi:hypothetical protein